MSHPETTRSTREYLATYVNGRYVSDGLLREAIVEAYGTQLAADRFPFAVLDVELPPAGSMRTSTREKWRCVSKRKPASARP